GNFDIDPQGRLVTPDGSIAQESTALHGSIQDGGALGNISLPLDSLSPAVHTGTDSFGGNLPSEADLRTTAVHDTESYDRDANAATLTFTPARSAAGWDVSGDGGTTTLGTLEFTEGALTSTGNVFNVGGIDVDMTQLTGFAGLTTAS